MKVNFAIFWVQFCIKIDVKTNQKCKQFYNFLGLIRIVKSIIFNLCFWVVKMKHRISRGIIAPSMKWDTQGQKKVHLGYELSCHWQHSFPSVIGLDLSSMERKLISMMNFLPFDLPKFSKFLGMKQEKTGKARQCSDNKVSEGCSTKYSRS